MTHRKYNVYAIGSVFVFFMIVSCKKRSWNAEVKGEKSEALNHKSIGAACQLKIPENSDIVAFSYMALRHVPAHLASKLTANPGIIQQWSWNDFEKEFVDIVLKESKIYNSTEISPIKSSMVAGRGIYFAETPWDSREYGDVLIMTKFAHGADYCSARTKEDQGELSNELVKSSTHAILYPFPSGSYSSSAIVVRDKSLFRKEDVSIVYLGKHEHPDISLPNVLPLPSGVEPETLSALELAAILANYKFSMSCSKIALKPTDRRLEQNALAKKACSQVYALKAKLNSGFRPLIPPGKIK